MPKFPRRRTSKTLRAALGAFLRNDKAATALEFALVAPPFFFMMLAIFELALVFMVSVTLDSATQYAARLVRTGQAQGAAYTETTFENAVCTNLGWLSSLCQADTDSHAASNSLYVDAEVKSSFGASNPAGPIQGGVWTPANLHFNIGGPGDIVVIHTYFQWKLITPVLYGGLQSLPGGITVISNTAVFRNEPYGP